MQESPANPRAQLHYIRDMLEQLKAISTASGSPFLFYLIDMAHQEAAKELQRRDALPSRREGHPTV
ncbi:MAG: hypothetical protein H7Y08_12730 [Rhizobiaceae bacterium]|nr:hypothetical protein [Rhizobiaceae bacterium]